MMAPATPGPWLSPGRKHRRRILLPPVQPILSPTGESPRSGSRFDPLEESDVDEEISIAEEVAWDGLEDEPRVLPIGRIGDRDRAELLEDFWGKIGFPVKEICPRGNNKVVIIYIFMFMINVYIPCYNCINRNIDT
jgi:hypothetical protein